MSTFGIIQGKSYLRIVSSWKEKKMTLKNSLKIFFDPLVKYKSQTMNNSFIKNCYVTELQSLNSNRETTSS